MNEYVERLRAPSLRDPAAIRAVLKEVPAEQWGIFWTLASVGLNEDKNAIHKDKRSITREEALQFTLLELKEALLSEEDNRRGKPRTTL